MALNFWLTEPFVTVPSASWPYKNVLLATCPHKDCSGKMIVPKSWPRKSKWGTAQCPHCFRVARIPGGKYRAMYKEIR